MTQTLTKQHKKFRRNTNQPKSTTTKAASSSLTILPKCENKEKFLLTSRIFLPRNNKFQHLVSKSTLFNYRTMASSSSSDQSRNRLKDERSPYLLQHAANPVHWYPWGEEAFKAAKDKNKMIFLSVGYSTCHWCHVMERESFESEEVSKIFCLDNHEPLFSIFHISNNWKSKPNYKSFRLLPL